MSPLSPSPKRLQWSGPSTSLGVVLDQLPPLGPGSPCSPHHSFLSRTWNKPMHSGCLDYALVCMLGTT